MYNQGVETRHHTTNHKGTNVSDTNNLTLPVTTHLAFQRLWTLDQTLVGTPEYLGVAFYWAHEYKHHLRIATPRQRKTIHDRLLAAGLELDGVSDRHKAIVERVLLKKYKRVYGLS